MIIERIEKQLAYNLAKIAEGDTFNGNKYKFKTTTGTVNLRDEQVAQSYNANIENNNYNVVPGTSYKTDYDMSTGSYQFEREYIIDVTVHLEDAVDNVRYKNIEEKVQSTISDIVHVLGTNHTLDKTCFSFIVSKINSSHNNINGNIQITCKCEYAYDIQNPDRLACN